MTFRTWLVFARLLAIVVVVSATVMCVGGCALVGVAGAVVDPPVVEAQYVPPKTPMLILVENQQNPSMSISESDELVSYIIDDLVTYKVCPLVERKKLQELRDQQEKQMEKMTISQIGKAVGAEQVLYVDLRQYNVGGIEGVPMHGRMNVAVRVVDVKTGKTVFPKMADAYPMSFETPLTVEHTDPVEMRRQLAVAAGTGIGRLLHSYEP